MHKCYSNCAYMHGYCSSCMVTIALAFNILLFFSLHLTLFFSLVWLSLHALFSSTNLHCSLESRHSHAIVDHLTHRCLRQSPMLSFFSVWWFWDFDKWVLMVRYSVALSSLTAAVPPPITSLAEALTNHRSSCRSSLHSLIAATFFFLCLMVLGFWSMSFDDFD